MSVSWSDIRDNNFRLEDAEDALGIDIRSRGVEHSAPCPLPTHMGDGDPNFSINSETYMWHCWSCGGGGGFPRLVEQVLDLDKDEALNWLCQFSDVDPANATIENKLKKLRAAMHRDLRRPMVRNPDLPWFPFRAIEDWVNNFEPAIQFAGENWGLSEETVLEFQLGFADRYKHRSLVGPAIIVPHWWGDNLVGWQARWVPEQKPKYVNSDDFPKKHTLFNWHRFTRGMWVKNDLFVVESFATVMKLHQFGYQAVATFGASVSEEQIRILSTWAGNVHVAFDNDTAGESGAKKLVEGLRQHVPVYRVPPPDHAKGDLGDLDKPEIDELISRAVPAILYHT